MQRLSLPLFALAASSALAASITLPPARPAVEAIDYAAATFVPASDPNVQYVGRTFINADGSRSFDWEGTQIFLNVNGATFVR